jgi:hypothetical protein
MPLKRKRSAQKAVRGGENLKTAHKSFGENVKSAQRAAKEAATPYSSLEQVRLASASKSGGQALADHLVRLPNVYLLSEILFPVAVDVRDCTV